MSASMQISKMQISKEYLKLIKRFPLRLIRDEATLEFASELFSELVMKGEKRNVDEDDYLSILGKLMREFESTNVAPLAKPMGPRRALESLMEDNNLSQSELARILDIQQSIISEFLSGKRSLSKGVVLKLSDYFKVSPELFLRH